MVGFTLHNVTEGLGIATPLIAAGRRFAVFAGLALLAGLPAVAGVWLGSQAVSPFWPRSASASAPARSCR